MLTKDDILKEIQRTAKENDGSPLGRGRFEKETGIKPYDWNKYWVRLSDAQIEAGFSPNKLTTAYPEEFLIEKMILLIRKLGKFPIYGELKIEKRNNPDFPDARNFFESKIKKHQFAQKVVDYCKNKGKCNDVISLCQPIIDQPLENQESSKNISIEIGEVYLFKSGKYYKIGKTNDTVRRGSELKIQLPERMDLIHSIKTDDPSGIEAYWHRRFESKRKNGEWFDLNSSDIKAFKRWRKII